MSESTPQSIPFLERDQSYPLVWASDREKYIQGSAHLNAESGQYFVGQFVVGCVKNEAEAETALHMLWLLAEHPKDGSTIDFRAARPYGIQSGTFFKAARHVATIYAPYIRPLQDLHVIFASNKTLSVPTRPSKYRPDPRMITYSDDLHTKAAPARSKPVAEKPAQNGLHYFDDTKEKRFKLLLEHPDLRYRTFARTCDEITLAITQILVMGGRPYTKNELIAELTSNLKVEHRSAQNVSELVDRGLKEISASYLGTLRLNRLGNHIFKWD